jgi:hypothetical protein
VESPTTQQIVYTAQFGTDTIATSGDGLYALEGYLAAQGPFNQVTTTGCHPQIFMTLNEVLPAAFGNTAGVILNYGGLPDVGGDIPFNWQRIVITMYSAASESLRGTIQLYDQPGTVGHPVQMSAFNVPIYIDDLKIYKVADSLDQWDAELFD